ncbi:Ig-like domain-containing protein [Aquimarina litoralis]|uniref:Ig-like domain-containing protein n=1 Tax=Aquimarina litoralis TaxID=584605 RepID=UPI001C5929FF|nr:Ig-like domain-containing protein [Aquimarina litoralis]MBW1297360.1 T9SS type A sorting domain-containing protein [Aquimarina litoralis]
MKRKLQFLMVFLTTVLVGSTTIAQNYVQLGQDLNGVGAFNRLGNAVSASDDGNTIAVASTNSIRMYRLNTSGLWTQIGNDISKIGNSTSLDITENGNRVVIGKSNQNTVSVYDLNANNQWVQIGLDITEAADTEFGFSVAMNSTGNRIVIGAPGPSFGSPNSIGFARVYELNSSNQWVQLGTQFDGINDEENLGRSVSISSDGNRIAIGALDGNTNRSGQVKIYDLNASNQWIQVGNDLNGTGVNSRFASDIEMSNDGSRIIVGADANRDAGLNTGEVQVFQLNSSNQWEQLGSDFNGGANDRLGFDVSISGDGTRIAIGSFNDDSALENAGAVRVYELDTSNEWILVGSAILGDQTSSFFGRKTSLNAQGSRLIVGAEFYDSQGFGNNGQVRVYEFDGTRPTATITSSLSSPTVENTIPITVTFSEPVTDFEVADITFGASNFIVSNIQGSGNIYTFNITITTQAPQTITIVIDENGVIDAAGNGNEASSQFSIEYDPTFINSVPSFNLPSNANQTVNEDEGDQTVNGFATGMDDGDSGAQTLTFNVSNDNNALFSVQPTIDIVTGNLTYTTADNANGVATVTVSLSDNGGTANGGVDTSANQIFTITINAINDAPSFDIPVGTTVTTSEFITGQIPSFATNIDDGDAEITQVLTFNVSNNNNALFSVQPTIDPVTGDLNYITLDDVSGTAIITVNLSDDGGTANGGVDTSANQTFTIEVLSINDRPEFNLPAVADQTVNEDAGAQTVDGFATGIDDGDTDMTQVLTFNVSNDNNALFSVQPTIDIATGNLTYTTANNANGMATVTVSLSDNGGTVNGGVDTSSDQTFTITVNAVNDAPSFDIPVGTIVPTSEFTTGRVPGLATNIDDGDAEVTQVLTFNVSNNNTSLFSVQPTIDLATGDLNYITFDDVSGTAIVTVNLSDDGGIVNGGVDTSADQTFTIIVNAVNDMPVFALPTMPDQIIAENSGAQIVNAFATGIDDGDANEVQTLTFNVSNDNTSLFSVQPSIDPVTGNLTYTPAANTLGIATVTVNLSDDGGTVNGGVDTSANQTFTITVADQTRPTATITSSLSSPTAENTIPITITFSEPVTGFEFTDLTIGGSNINSSAIQGSGDTYTFTMSITVGQPQTITITLNENGVTDASGNGNEASSQFSIEYSPTLSNEDFELDAKDVVFFPNPATNSITFRQNSILKEVTVYSMEGKLMDVQDLSQNQTVDISSLSRGVYLLQVQTELGVITKRLIKQ